MVDIFEVFKWPIAIIVISIFFFLLFRSPIIGLIKRISSISKSGIKTELPLEQQKDQKKEEAIKKLTESAGSYYSLELFENNIKSDLKNKGLETAGETLSIVIKHLAATQIHLEFEIIYNLILGSQLFLLKKFNQFSNLGIPLEVLEKHFEGVKEKYKKEFEDWTFELYIKFLTSRSLVTSIDKVFYITPLGIDFLTWVVKSGKSDEKMY